MHRGTYHHFYIVIILIRNRRRFDSQVTLDVAVTGIDSQSRANDSDPDKHLMTEISRLATTTIS